MELYFSPLACSMATRIALYEAGAEARYVYVDKERKTEDGADYLAVNPLGLVPTLRLDDGVLLTENSAILRYLADRFSPAAPEAQSRIQQWIGFVNSELHTGAYSYILNPAAPEAVREFALAKAKRRFDYLDGELGQRDWLADEYSVADGYLAVVLNWAQFRGPDLAAWPNLVAYKVRLTAREAVRRAMTEEFELFQAEQKRQAA